MRNRFPALLETQDRQAEPLLSIISFLDEEPHFPPTLDRHTMYQSSSKGCSAKKRKNGATVLASHTASLFLRFPRIAVEPSAVNTSEAIVQQLSFALIVPVTYC